MSYFRTLAMSVTAICILLQAGPGWSREEPAGPASSLTADISVAGETLDTALPRIGRAYGLQLAAAGALKAQRVTLHMKNARAEQLAEGLRELLSAGPEAPVFWTRRGAGSWRLEESVKRRKLAAALQNQDLEVFRHYLEKEIGWLRGEGEKEFASAPSGSVIRAVLNDRVAYALMLETLGEAGREKLLSGSPLVCRLPPNLQARAQSEAGLPFREVPQALVDTWLMTTLVAEVGAVTPEFRNRLLFSLRPYGAQRGYELRISNEREEAGCNWVRRIYLPTSQPARPTVQ